MVSGCRDSASTFFFLAYRALRRLHVLELVVGVKQMHAVFDSLLQQILIIRLVNVYGFHRNVAMLG